MQTDRTAVEIGAEREAGGSGLPKWVRIGLVAGVLVAALAAFFAFDLDRHLSLQTLADNRAWLLEQVAQNTFVVVVVFIAIYAVAVAASVPGAVILTLASGFLFGTALGTVYAVIGATLGAVALFLFVRAGLGDSLKARAGSSIDRFRRGFHDNALGYLLFLRLLPVVPFWFVNLAAALLGVPLRTFTLATALGIIPGAAVFASVGSGLGFILDEEGAGEPELGVILTPEVILPLVGLALLSLAPVLYKAIKRRRSAGGE